MNFSLKGFWARDRFTFFMKSYSRKRCGLTDKSRSEAQLNHLSGSRSIVMINRRKSYSLGRYIIDGSCSSSRKRKI
jgi:hypothetical protein